MAETRLLRTNRVHPGLNTRAIAQPELSGPDWARCTAKGDTLRAHEPELAWA